MPSAGFVQVLADGSVTALWLGYGLVEVKERLQVDRATYEGKLFPKKEAEKKDHECVPVLYFFVTRTPRGARARAQSVLREYSLLRAHTRIARHGVPGSDRGSAQEASARCAREPCGS